MTDLPRSQQPKVKATYAGGLAGAGIGGLIVYGWNAYVGPMSPLYLDGFMAAAVAGMLTTFAAGAVGPIYRRWQAWGEASEERQLVQDELRHLLKEFIARQEAKENDRLAE